MLCTPPRLRVYRTRPLSRSNFSVWMHATRFQSTSPIHARRCLRMERLQLECTVSTARGEGCDGGWGRAAEDDMRTFGDGLNHRGGPAIVKGRAPPGLPPQQQAAPGSPGELCVPGRSSPAHRVRSGAFAAPRRRRAGRQAHTGWVCGSAISVNFCNTIS